ncbi:MAG: hypothetical protein WCH46_04065 [bacterium]
MRKYFYTVGFCLFIITAICSCGPSLEAQREEIENGMKSWVGKSENQLVATWGAPTRSYKMTDGSRELTWIFSHTTNGPRYAWHDYWGNIHFSRPARHQTKTERSFTIDNTATIVHYHWEGF